MGRRKADKCLRCETIKVAEGAILRILKRKTINAGKIRILLEVIRDFEVNPCACEPRVIAGEVVGTLLDTVRRG